MYEYRCVSGPIIVYVRSAKDRDKAVEQFAEIMNREAAHGWEYVSMDEFTTTNPSGCFNFSGPEVVRHKMLVFRRLLSPQRMNPTPINTA
jgi:hypothetical protein